MNEQERTHLRGRWHFHTEHQLHFSTWEPCVLQRDGNRIRSGQLGSPLALVILFTHVSESFSPRWDGRISSLWRTGCGYSPLSEPDGEKSVVWALLLFFKNISSTLTNLPQSAVIPICFYYLVMQSAESRSHVSSSNSQLSDYVNQTAVHPSYTLCITSAPDCPGSAARRHSESSLCWLCLHHTCVLVFFIRLHLFFFF